MARWNFWGDKEFSDVYENVYIRSFVEDWFRIVVSMVKEIDGAPGRRKLLLDVGCGEGHTTKQILDRLHTNYICDLLEPDRAALSTAEAFLKPENSVGKMFLQTLATFQASKKYHCIFTSHTNYYWAINEKEYQRQLDKLTSLLVTQGRLCILTLPKESGHYRIMLRQIYPTFNYAEYIERYYAKKGFRVKKKELRMRLYVGDMLTTHSQFDLKTFYRFIHNTDSYPGPKETRHFLRKIRRVQKNGYIDFKDHLITVTI